MGVLLDSTVIIAGERSGKNPRQVIDEIAAGLDDTEATLSVMTVLELTESSGPGLRSAAPCGSGSSKSYLLKSPSSR